jgi:hypothetical protein
VAAAKTEAAKAAAMPAGRPMAMAALIVVMPVSFVMPVLFVMAMSFVMSVSVHSALLD